MDAKNLADLYDCPPLGWNECEAALSAGYTQAPDTGGPNRHSTWLATIDPRCTIALAMHAFDLVVEGEAELVADPAFVADVAARFAADGWPAEVDASGTALTAPSSAPSAGPPPWHVYRVVPRTATVLGTVEPGGATRFTF